MDTNRLEEKANALRSKAERIDMLSYIYVQTKRNMEWDSMVSHDIDEEHEEVWFTAPDSDDNWRRPKYEAYVEVLSAIEKLADK